MDVLITIVAPTLTTNDLITTMEDPTLTMVSQNTMVGQNTTEDQNTTDVPTITIVLTQIMVVPHALTTMATTFAMNTPTIAKLVIADRMVVALEVA